MICYKCVGTGFSNKYKKKGKYFDAIVCVPCKECGGNGILHCCEGLQACPETDTEEEVPLVEKEEK